MHALLALLACTPGPIAPPTDTEDTVLHTETADTSSEDTSPPEDTEPADTAPEDTGPSWHGVAPDPPIDLPKFAATNRDGQPRGPEHLQGDPTIIWFFRDAGSAG